jgi:MFS family permease
MPAMSVGQIAEIGTMAVLGYCLKLLGWRYTMVIGILGHALRFAVFAWLPIPWLAVAINVVHGICYAFFFATVYIFVDEFFPKDARASAQGLFNFMILGMGPLVAYFLWPYLGKVYEVVNWQVTAPTVVGLLGSPGAPGALLVSNTPATTMIEFNRLFLIPSAVALVAAVMLFAFFRPPETAKEKVEKTAEEPQPV